uniref:Limiting CO2-inducible protein B/C beta carbonyic anhydrase domain-containing protein n=1 Tax=Odontella aurita TaxID=265563 RepID=A0A7S4K5B1_9STRA|mmetsp:Transcript_61855/g.182635  ORF Transcript_61855/g.182635 Transcript_61855/m.182635 type:complete len:383 (+) Transcript_61855:44-1192(+)
MRLSNVALFFGLFVPSTDGFFACPDGGRRTARPSLVRLPASAGLDSMTVPQLKELVRTSNPERGVLTKLKKKADLIRYLEGREDVVGPVEDDAPSPVSASSEDESSVEIAPAAAAADSADSSPTAVDFRRDDNKPFDRIDEIFPGALTNADLVRMIADTLTEGAGYDLRKTLLATSLSCDEASRPLEEDFAAVFGGANFNMGGLAGFPFGGRTGFESMAAHIPDGGSCLVAYGPLVGVDSSGEVGTVERRGRAGGGACCESAQKALEYALSVFRGEAQEAPAPSSMVDAQQYYVGSMLLPYAERLEHSDERMVELPYTLYDAQTELMEEIVAQSGKAVAGDGTTAVLGGIQINTPPGYSDYYLPLSFQLYNSDGDYVEDLWE